MFVQLFQAIVCVTGILHLLSVHSQFSLYICQGKVSVPFNPLVEVHALELYLLTDFFCGLISHLMKQPYNVLLVFIVHHKLLGNVFCCYIYMSLLLDNRLRNSISFLHKRLNSKRNVTISYDEESLYFDLVMFMIQCYFPD